MTARLASIAAWLSLLVFALAGLGVVALVLWPVVQGVVRMVEALGG